jgi:hypothetical protein
VTRLLPTPGLNFCRYPPVFSRFLLFFLLGTDMKLPAGGSFTGGRFAGERGLYIDVGLIVGPGRTWRPLSPLFTSRPNFFIFLFSLPYIFFLVYFFTKSESTTLD